MPAGTRPLGNSPAGKFHRATGLPVFDAPDELVITLTEKDVARASRSDPLNCALAMACRRQADSPYVVVRRSMAYVQHQDKVYRYTFPKATAIYIGVFDLTGKFPAGEYWFVPFAPAGQLGKRDHQKDGKMPNRRQNRSPKVVGGLRPSGSNERLILE
jgi:hypothetical protein